MKLVIDIGNTFAKLAVFENEKILELVSIDEIRPSQLESLLLRYPKITASIISSVKKYDPLIEQFLASKTKLLKFDHHMQLPFNNNYGTPETLGRDRMAVMAAAGSIYKNQNVLIIDAGTCITYDILQSDNTYLGGAISPGIQMRFKALNTFTGNLPFIQTDNENNTDLVGKSTASSILSGVKRAVIHEVDGMINDYKQQFKDLEVVVTGGDYNYFDKYLKNSIFAAPNLVLIGLKKILEFNEDS